MVWGPVWPGPQMKVRNICDPEGNILHLRELTAGEPVHASDDITIPYPATDVSALRLSAVTSHPRHALVAKLTDALNAVGSVLDSHQFSNIALSIQFEMPAQKMAPLRAALVALSMVLSADSLDALERAQTANLAGEIAGSVHVTFVHNEPDLRAHIPAVPG